MDNSTFDPTPAFAAPETLPSNSEFSFSAPSWSPLQRLGFRIAFIYFFCFMFLYGNGSLLLIIYMLPVVGGKIAFAFTWPTNHLAEIIGKHFFHLTGIAATWHGTGSGDTALNWILNGVFIAAALICGLLWTGISALRGNRRTEYAVLYAWLRFFLRLTVGMFMIGYGMGKVFPSQMQPISIAVLNEPLGQSSPMTMLWSLIALHPLYESICGLAEVIGGVLILFRRTALLGALISAFVMINVLLFNIFFDVPVKLFAFNLLLAILFLALPDVTSLFSFFWKHQPSAPVGVWIPPVKRRGFRIATRSIELFYTVVFLLLPAIFSCIGWHRNQVEARKPTPLFGAWHLDSNHPASGAFITGEGLPATDFYVDDATRAFRRASDGALWRTYLKIEPAAHTITIFPYPGGRPSTYAWQMSDANHLSLTTVPPPTPPTRKMKPGAKAPPSAAKPAPPFVPQVVTFTRTPIPSHYPLLDRGFHWINPWGLER